MKCKMNNNVLTTHAVEPRFLACPECGGRVTESTRDDLLIIKIYDCTDLNHAANCEVNEYYDAKYIDYVCETNGCPTTREELIKTFLYATHSNP